MDSDNEPFLYIGQSMNEIPLEVTHVRVDLSVKEIGENAFYDCNQLRNVELCDGLERIDCGAFEGCTLLERIIIPSTVKFIGKWAFHECSWLRNVELHEGLERIDAGAFANCTLLERIIIPSTVKFIGKWAFHECSWLRNVELHEGLERIDEGAFKRCSLLERIRIPSTVKYIASDAFKDCNSLIAAEFCDKINQFVDEVSLDWWNNGISNASLMTYSFLARCNIPARLEKLTVRVWKKHIYNMLRRFPEKLKDDEDDDDDEEEGDEQEDEENGDTYYFDSIESQLSNYEHLQEVAPFLELALWKAKITEQSSGNLIQDDTKILCRVNSFSMFAIIFPNVLAFLFEE